MLTYLRVRNLGVLEDAQIEPGPGFTVVTGETGAGKTMLLGALRLLVGDKPQPSLVGPFAEEALSEGLFEDGEEEIGSSRVVPREGRSRAYLDGALVSAAALGDRISRLVEIVGQHDHVLLRRNQAVMQLIDAALDEEGRRAKRRYQEAWSSHRSLLDRQRRLGGDSMALERELDLVRHQANEIASAGFEPDDEQAMEAAAARLRGIAAIREGLALAANGLDGAAERIGEIVVALRKVAGVDGAAAGLLSSAEAIAAETQELVRSVRAHADSTEEDPEALSLIEQRLTLLGDLKRKYGRTLEEVIEFGEEAARRAAELDELLARASTIGEQIEASAADLVAAGTRLTEMRRAAAGRVEEETRAHLAAMGLAAAAVRFEIEPAELSASGAERVELLFASDNRLQAGAAGEVASGGELSRLVLALRLATRVSSTSTLVFDEVDAGVGGATALALGRKLADLARHNQVLCVTHLPQVAAQAETHYVVDRSGGSATVRRVEGEERLTELSRMLAGLPESERGREAAAELLEAADRG